MGRHGYELEHIRIVYPEIQAETLEATIVPGLEWVMSKYNRPIMIDDSGLFVDALKGFPGVYSSYVFKTIGCDGILSLMAGVKDRSARFECCIGFIRPGDKPFLAKGTAPGSISLKKIGTGGFGYDPIFVPEGYDRTYAQFDIDEKNRISHRGRAIAILVKELPRLLA